MSVENYTMSNEDLEEALKIANANLDALGERNVPGKIQIYAGLMLADLALRRHIHPAERMLPAINLQASLLRSVAQGISDDLEALMAGNGLTPERAGIVKESDNPQEDPPASKTH